VFSVFIQVYLLQSTAPSHRLGSNVQNVIAAMKHHNPRLCAAAATRPRPRSAGSKRAARRREPSSERSESEAELGELLTQLIEEYTHMTA